MPPRKPPKKTNGNCLASLILALCWLGGVGSLLAVIFGFVGRKQIRESEGSQTGGALAVAGIILGLIGIAADILTFVLLAVFATNVNNSIENCVHNPNTAACDGGITNNTGNTGSSSNTGNTGSSSNTGNTGSFGNTGNSGNSGTAPTTSNSGNTGNGGVVTSLNVFALF
jgi:hypothetical protein